MANYSCTGNKSVTSNVVTSILIYHLASAIKAQCLTWLRAFHHSTPKVCNKNKKGQGNHSRTIVRRSCIGSSRGQCQPYCPEGHHPGPPSISEGPGPPIVTRD